MSQVRSIRENPSSSGLPDFGKLGIWWRVLLAVNGGALLGTLAANREWRFFVAEFVELATLIEPVTLVSLLLLSLMSAWLVRLPKRRGAMLVVLLVLLVTAAVRGLFAAMQLIEPDVAGFSRISLWAAIGVVLLLGWFEVSGRARSPALAEARLLALTARIRPHFLFNALNAVLGVMRSDPRRAETALEELADLFHVLMRENADLVPLSEEILVARQYINLERLRLGERIHVTWDMMACPPDPLVPPLMLQPLLENAVYHGIEPATEPGEIIIRFECKNSRLRVELSNPTAVADSHTHGNQMALANIRERLMLFFDLEATMTTQVGGGRFCVSIEFPYRPVTAR
ncbi:MAG: two-component system sensor ATPase [Rhodocyclaceae bacterium]|nr:MAG: two-component system sensor ATPase [Rhodocyclaceae bacterium]TND00806.1 MAG: two-component system sensor ATPase [Rhodocyclaceae bacterium]